MLNKTVQVLLELHTVYSQVDYSSSKYLVYLLGFRLPRIIFNASCFRDRKAAKAWPAGE